MVFQLGQRLGGRSEVINAPVVDLFGYLISEFERKDEEAKSEVQRLLLEHSSRMHANPNDKKSAKANEKFIKSLQKQLNANGATTDDGHKMLGTANNDVIGSDNWNDFDKLKALENR